jgi:hypothetical protein
VRTAIVSDIHGNLTAFETQHRAPRSDEHRLIRETWKPTAVTAFRSNPRTTVNENVDATGANNR